MAIVHLNFSSGVTGLYDANRVTYVEQVRCPTYGTMTVEGTEGMLRLDENGGIWVTPRGGIELQHDVCYPE